MCGEIHIPLSIGNSHPDSCIYRWNTVLVTRILAESLPASHPPKHPKTLSSVLTRLLTHLLGRSISSSELPHWFTEHSLCLEVNDFHIHLDPVTFLTGSEQEARVVQGYT